MAKIEATEQSIQQIMSERAVDSARSETLHREFSSLRDWISANKPDLTRIIEREAENRKLHRKALEWSVIALLAFFAGKLPDILRIIFGAE